jgi:hypothetical protein
MVSLIETAIMDLLKLYDIESQLKDGAPGVYVQGAKIAALGLKVKLKKLKKERMSPDSSQEDVSIKKTCTVKRV